MNFVLLLISLSHKQEVQEQSQLFFVRPIPSKYIIWHCTALDGGTEDHFSVY